MPSATYQGAAPPREEAPASPELARGKEMLGGFISSFARDGKIGVDEAATLKLWMMTHGSLRGDPTCQRIYQLLTEVLADGVIDEGEQRELVELFGEVITK